MMFRDERGTTVIEALMAILVLVLGVIGTFSTMDGVKELGMLTEKKQSATRYAQGELEAMRKMGWSNLKLSASPATMNDSRGVVSGGNYTPPNGGTAQPLVIASVPANCTATTCVSPGPDAWTYGSASGYIYRFITSSHDDLCGAACPAGTDHIRVTVAVTVNAPNGPTTAVVSSSVVVDPAAAPANATQNANPVVSTGRHVDRRVDRHHVLPHRHADRRDLRGAYDPARGAQHDRRERRARPATRHRPADAGFALSDGDLVLDRRAAAG
jgi:hypothetical protein